MATLRERAAKLLLGKELDKLNRVTAALVEEWRNRPVSARPDTDDILDALRETADPMMVDFLLRQLRYQDIGAQTSDEARITTVKDARYLYMVDPITQRIIDLWTDYAFGLSVEVVPDAEKAKQAWLDFWNGRQNRRVFGSRFLADLSKTLLVDGEFYIVKFTSRLDGEQTVRIVPTEEITEIITDPQDRTVNLYYRRDYSLADGSMYCLYYPDHNASERELERAQLPDGAIIADAPETAVSMMQVAHRMYNGRGWSLMMAGAPWSRAYRQFIQDRLAVAKAAATFPEKIKIKGGSRSIDLVRARLESSLISSSDGIDTNPPPAAGATWLENEALERSWMSRSTGGVDAEKDGNLALAQAGLAGGIFPHYLGRGESFRLATASAMEVPVMKVFDRYQAFWKSVWQELCEWVLQDYEIYGGYNFGGVYTSSVQMDAVVSADVQQIGSFLATVNTAMVSGSIDASAGRNALNELIIVALQTLGVDDAFSVMYPEKTEETEEMSEKDYTFQDYRRAIKTAFYGLWRGDFTPPEFVESMQAAIDRGLTLAYYQGAATFGIRPEELTSDETFEIQKFITGQFSHIDNAAEYVMARTKERGGLLRELNDRIDLWAERYWEMFNAGRVSAGKNQKFIWQLGATEEHCEDCLHYAGQVHRGSVWQASGAMPKSSELGCKGFRCDCSLDPTEEPGTPGRLRPPTGR